MIERARKLGDDAGVDRHGPEPGEMALHPRALTRREKLLEHVLERHLAGRRRPAIRGPAQRVPQRAGDPLPPRGVFVAEVGGITAEQLVGAFSRENDFDVAARCLGKEKGGEHGGIAERLGEGARHHIERAAERFVIGGDDVVHGSDLVRDGLGIRALVVAGLREVHGVGVDPLVGDGTRGRRHEERGVEAAAREDPERHIGHQLALDRTQQQLAQLGGVVERERRAARGLRRAPVRPDLGLAVFGDQDRRRRQLVDPFEHRVRRRDVPERVIQRKGLSVYASRLIGKLQQRLDLRREPKLALDLGPEERLLARSIAREHQAATRIIPDREAKHPFQSRDRAGAKALVKRHDVFDVAARSKRVAPGRRFAAQRGRIVDLTVAHHPDLSVGTLERLIARGEIHDGEAARADAGALVPDDALTVRAAVTQRSRHPLHRLRKTQWGSASRYRAEDAAHGP